MIELEALVIAHKLIAAVPEAREVRNAKCSLDNIIKQVPEFSDNNILIGVIIEVEYEIEKISRKFKNKFLLDFYKANNENSVDKSMLPRDWINKKEFDLFLIYEFNESDLPKKYPVAFAYISGPLLVSSYTISGNEKMWRDAPRNERYFQKPFCAAVQGNDAYSAILNLLKAVGVERFRNHMQHHPK